MSDTISLPHPIRSEAERENLIAAMAEATDLWGHEPVASSVISSRLPSVEPMPELAEPFGVLCRGKLVGIGYRDAATALRDGRHDAYRVVRLVVAEVVEPVPVCPEAVSPSGRRYRNHDGVIEVCASDGSRWYESTHFALDDVSVVAALLKGGEG